MGSDSPLWWCYGETINFNPRSHVGSDKPTAWSLIPLQDFNPRSHVGSDYVSPPDRSGDKISIHAPTWGATCKLLAHKQYVTDFNPRSHVGSDAVCGHMAYVVLIFQSTLPRGERLKLLHIIRSPRIFQSTLPRGERPSCTIRWRHLTGFQSTLPRGERRRKLVCQQRLQ